MKLITFLVMLLAVNSVSAITSAELDNIFSDETKLTVEAQENIKSRFTKSCGIDLSWILSISENAKEHTSCEQNPEREIISFRVELPHLASNFVFLYDTLSGQIPLVFKEEAVWKICQAPFTYEVDSKEKL